MWLPVLSKNTRYNLKLKFPINSPNRELCNEKYMLIMFYQILMYRQTGKDCLARLNIAYMVLLCIIVAEYSLNQPWNRSCELCNEKWHKQWVWLRLRLQYHQRRSDSRRPEMKIAYTVLFNIIRFHWCISSVLSLCIISFILLYIYIYIVGKVIFKHWLFQANSMNVSLK